MLIDMSSALTDNPMVQQLADKFQLNIPRSFRGIVTDWEIKNDAIVINSVDMYDTDGKFVKKADLSQLAKSAHQFTFLFIKKP